MVEENLLFKDYKPVSTLVLDEHVPDKAKYPLINAHTHLGLRIKRPKEMEDMIAQALAPVHVPVKKTLEQFRRKYKSRPIEKVIETMDACNVDKLVDLDGISPLREYVKIYADSPDRFIIFYVLRFEDIDDPKYGEKKATELEEAVSNGARGLKIHKVLGLTIRDKPGRIVAVDDSRFDPVFEKAGDLGVPVLIHVSDPAAFFLPVDRHNPSYVILKYTSPEWSFYGPEYLDKWEILRQRDNVLERHPKTIFIGAHQGNYPENLGYVASLLDKYDNFYVEFSARYRTLGLQPYTARKHFIKYQDRILFGTDGCPNTLQYQTYFRFLETEDEYFDGRPWGDRIYGINLPDNVLAKIYRKNADKIIPQN
ncbi:MAG: amidohydrolase family protein [Candidatus Bathyarchaeota archaeon]|nr:amidohydrolase family protein [Candidatus Bathyarchaeota archaeon]